MSSKADHLLKALGISVAIRRTRCMSCGNPIVGGEYRMAFVSRKVVSGKNGPFDKSICRYICLQCAKGELTHLVREIRLLRRKVLRKLREDKAYYATKGLGPEFAEQAVAVVKWRVDKITARRNSNKKKHAARVRRLQEAAKRYREAAKDAAATETKL